MDQKAPPQAIDAEKAAIGAVLCHCKKVLRHSEGLQVTSDWFFLPDHKKIWASIQSMRCAGKIIDSATLTTFMNDTGMSFCKNLNEYINGCIDACRSPSNFTAYFEILKDKYHKRAGVQIMRDAETELFSEKSADEIISTARLKLSQLRHKQRTKPDKKQIISNLFKKFNEAKEKGYTGISSRWYKHQRKFGGYRPGKVTILAGRPSSGKTTMLFNEVANIAEKHNTPCGIIELEMHMEETIKKIIGGMACVDLSKFDDGSFTKEEIEKFAAAGERFTNLPIFIEEGPMSGEQVCATMRDFKVDYEVEFVGIDYLTRISPSVHYRSRNEEVAAWSTMIANTALDTDLATALLSQLSREGSDKPQLKHLRDSGAIEQDAQHVIFLYKDPDVEGKHDDDVSWIVETAKNKEGKTGYTRLLFKKSWQLFLDGGKKNGEREAF